MKDGGNFHYIRNRKLSILCPSSPVHLFFFTFRIWTQRILRNYWWIARKMVMRWRIAPDISSTETLTLVLHFEGGEVDIQGRKRSTNLGSTQWLITVWSGCECQIVDLQKWQIMCDTDTPYLTSEWCWLRALLMVADHLTCSLDRS